MIVYFGKQLIQWNFLECGHAQNLQNIVEGRLHVHPFPDDRNKSVNRDGHPDLCSYSVLRCPVKRFDPKILFDPAEEQFHLPAELVEFGDCQSRQMKVIRQEDQVTIVFSIIETHPTKRLGILGLGLGTGQDDRLVRGQVHGFIDGLRAESSRLKVRFGSGDEEGSALMKSIEPGVVQISSVQKVERTRLKWENVEDSNIMRFPFCDMDKCRDGTSQVEECMEFDGPFPFSKKSPRKKRQAQIDRGRIEGVNRVLEIQSDVLVPVEYPSLGDEDVSEVGINPPVAIFVGMGQVVPRNVAADAHVIEPIFHRSQAGHDIAETFPVGQLGNGQTKKLIETRKSFDLVVPSVTPHAFSEFVHRQKRHDLGKDGRRGVHRSLPEDKKSADYTKSRSNRLRLKCPLFYSLCA
jgi:hypothetical protein